MKKDNLLQLILLLSVSFFIIACEKDNANDSVVNVTPATPVNPANKAPVAHAGDDAIIYVPLNSYVLNGTKSTDPDGDKLTYAWRIIDGQPIFGKTEFLGSANVSFSGIAPGNYVFELTVTDIDKLSSKDTVKLSCITPVCTGGDKEVIIRNVTWDNSWIMVAIIKNLHSYLPPNSYVKKFYIKRDGATNWEAVIPSYSDPVQTGKVPEWDYGNETLAIYPGTNTKQDTPDIKIEYCN